MRTRLSLVDEHAAGRRAFAVEGTGSFGAGLTRFLGVRGERVLEVGRLRRERRSGGKTDALDAIRAARSVLAQQRPATPRAGGEREALRALMAAREGAVNAKRAGLCQLRESPRHNTRAAPRSAAPADPDTAAATPGSDTTRAATRPELRGALLALRAVRATRAAADPPRNGSSHARSRTITCKLAPQLLEPARRRTARCRTAPPLLGPPRPDRLPRPRLHDSRAAHRSAPPPGKKSATASTAAATADSTGHCT